MKKVYLFLLIGIVFIAAVFPPAQRKVALIIAIGEYPEGGKWRNLSSMNDVKYVKDALIKTGFSANDIDTLCNKNATKSGMVKALDDLYNKVGEGDIVYFQFSGSWATN
ncbi:MAG: caspase family protein [Chitinophagaceae bacterium]